MDSDDVSNSLRNWKVFKLISKKYKSAVVNPSIGLFNIATLIGNFHGADILVTLETLVGELSIKDCCVKVHFLSTVLASC